MERRTVDRLIYGVIIIVIAGLMVTGIVVRVERRRTGQARAKAEQLVSLLRAEDLPAPSVDVAMSLFGTDGGAAAANSDNPLALELLAMRVANGSERRPVILDRDLFKAEAAVLAVYAPDKLPAFEKYVARMNFADTLPEQETP